MNPPVTVVIPTFRRPDGIALAADSVFKQTGCPDFDLLIVDNDPAASSRTIAEHFKSALPAGISLTCLHEPRAGVANARNAAVAKVRTRLIAFLDDDQTASPGWLAALLSCHTRFPAPVTFGPVRAVLPEDGSQHEADLKEFFSRPEFDPRTNDTDGEDGLLFGGVRKAGSQCAWCAEAVTLEHVPASRARFGYTLRRAMAHGQGPITLARRQTSTNWLVVAFWMCVGTYKLAANSVLYAWSRLTRNPNRAWHIDRAARGFGKLIWWVSFRFYGAARL